VCLSLQVIQWKRCEKQNKSLVSDALLLKWCDSRCEIHKHVRGVAGSLAVKSVSSGRWLCWVMEGSEKFMIMLHCHVCLI